MKVICAVAVCLVLVCSVQDANSLGWDDFSSYWFPYYWRSQTTSVTSYSSKYMAPSGELLFRNTGTSL